ncbi:MAG TPA: hypothetical protein VF549_12330 [Solirubrobacteraceae bacterium]|jgi:hypothetical protein
MKPTILVALAALALGTAAAPAQAVTNCPNPVSVAGRAYDVHVHHGLTCRPGRGAVRSFLKSGSSPAGWRCYRGHGVPRLAAVCAQLKHPRHVARAYRVREV